VKEIYKISSCGKVLNLQLWIIYLLCKLYSLFFILGIALESSLRIKPKMTAQTLSRGGRKEHKMAKQHEHEEK
jgi:hypothetical protein